MRPYAESIAMIMRRERMPAIGAYDTMKSNTSSMDDLSANVLDYSSYWLSMSVIFTLKNIMGMIFFVSGGSDERKNGALKVVDIGILS